MGSHTGGAVNTTKSTYGVPGAQVLRDASGVYYVLGDHLGSASVTLNAAGGVVGELRCDAYGATRLSTGTTPTDRRYTGQRQENYIKLIQMKHAGMAHRGFRYNRAVERMFLIWDLAMEISTGVNPPEGSPRDTNGKATSER